MWEPVSLPFRNTSPPAPSTLPTPDQIRACRNTLWDTEASKVVAVNDEIVVKFGSRLEVWEGQALIYLERHAPQVPTPRLYAMYHDSEQLFLIMQRAPGVSLDSIWPTLTQPEKDEIIVKLQKVFDNMRQIKCPWPNFFGSLDGGAVPHYLFWCRKGSGRQLGPFDDEATFVAALTANYRAAVERKGWPDHKTRFYEMYLPQLLQGHRPTLTHGDVQQKNIVVAENTGQGTRSFDVMLVDWEAAGWYPDFWEIFAATSTPLFLSWEDDWCWKVHEFLEVWPAEMAIMRMFDSDGL